jgi:hypothetical protein
MRSFPLSAANATWEMARFIARNEDAISTDMSRRIEIGSSSLNGFIIGLSVIGVNGDWVQAQLLGIRRAVVKAKRKGT